MNLQRQFRALLIVLLLVMCSCSQELVPPEVAEEPDTSVNDTIPDNSAEDPPEEDPGTGDGSEEQGGNDGEEGGGEEEDPEGGSEEIAMYFPPAGQGAWSTIPPDSLGWDTTAVENLVNFLEAQNTRAFLVLYRGHIVLEHYNGQAYQGGQTFDQNSKWYWASAGKTLTAFLAGMAGEQGFLDINAPSSTYLGDTWSSVPPEKQELIRVKDHLSMTSGLDEKVKDNTPNDVVDDDCTDPECLQYKADAGSRWSYHNAPYNLLDEIISNATGNTYEVFSRDNLEIPIGMTGEWRVQEVYNTIYWGTARDAARFGLIMLNEGSWDGNTLLNDPGYFNDMISVSQDHNPAYGYLWWLNTEGAGDFYAPDAPQNMYTAAGLDGQFIDVVPELELVVVRLGELNGTNEKELHANMWSMLNQLIQFNP